MFAYSDRQRTKESCIVLIRAAPNIQFIFNLLWITMMDMGYPLHLIDLLAKLYRKQLAKVKVAGTLSYRIVSYREGAGLLSAP